MAGWRDEEGGEVEQLTTAACRLGCPPAAAAYGADAVAKLRMNATRSQMSCVVNV
jgi:hypothetical protein